MGGTYTSWYERTTFHIACGDLRSRGPDFLFLKVLALKVVNAPHHGLTAQRCMGGRGCRYRGRGLKSINIEAGIFE